MTQALFHRVWRLLKKILQIKKKKRNFSNKAEGNRRNGNMEILFRPKDAKCPSGLPHRTRKKKDAFWGVYREKSNIVNFWCISQFPRKCSSHRHYFLCPKIKEKKNASIHPDLIFPSQSIVLRDRKNENEKTLSDAFFEKFFPQKVKKKTPKFCLLGVSNQ